MLERAKKEGRVRRVHCNVRLSPPWIMLIEQSEGGVKTPIPFVVEDGRLANPAKTLAILSLAKGSFKPFKFLSEAEKKDVPRNVTVAPIPLPVASSSSSAPPSNGGVAMEDESD